MSKENTTLAFVAGALMGGVAALLLAPQSGRETREQVQGTARDAIDQGREKIGDAADNVAHRARSARDTVSDSASKVSDTAQDQVDAVREAVDAGRQAYSEELHKRQTSAR